MEKDLPGRAEASATSLGRPLAHGRTAEIYPWRSGQILKLFRIWFPPEAAEWEASIVRVVHAAGLPIPAVGEILEIGGRVGLTYERVQGLSMTRAMLARPWASFRFARRLAELHAAIHACTTPEVPAQHQQLEDRIRAARTLPSDLKRAALGALARLPDGDRLCHGDFGPNNVLVTAAGLMVIDWIDATVGNPLADVARTSLLLKVSAPAGRPATRPLLAALRGCFRRAYLNHYFQLRPWDRQQLEAWQPVIAAARLSEYIIREQERLLARVRTALAPSACG